MSLCLRQRDGPIRAGCSPAPEPKTRRRRLGTQFAMHPQKSPHGEDMCGAPEAKLHSLLNDVLRSLSMHRVSPVQSAVRL